MSPLDIQMEERPPTHPPSLTPHTLIFLFLISQIPHIISVLSSVFYLLFLRACVSVCESVCAPEVDPRDGREIPQLPAFMCGAPPRGSGDLSLLYVSVPFLWLTLIIKVYNRYRCEYIITRAFLPGPLLLVATSAPLPAVRTQIRRRLIRWGLGG